MHKNTKINRMAFQIDREKTECTLNGTTKES